MGIKKTRRQGLNPLGARIATHEGLLSGYTGRDGNSYSLPTDALLLRVSRAEFTLVPEDGP
jgi:hypothetical protein